MAAALVMKSLPVSFEVFLVLSVILGIGIGVIDSNQSSLLVDLDPGRTGQNLGMLHGIFGLGGLLLPILIRQMLAVMDWRYVYLILGGVAWGIGVHADSAWMVLGACVIAGLGSGGCIPILLNEGAEFNRENSGLVTNLMMIIKTVGQITCPLLISYVMEFTSMKTAMYWIVPLFVLDGIVAGILLRLKERNAFFINTQND